MRISVHIENIKWDSCQNTIVQRLSEIKNIKEVEVNNEECTVTFNYKTNHDFDSAKKLLSRIGHPIVGKENKINTIA